MNKSLTLEILEELQPKYKYQLELIDSSGWLAKIILPDGRALSFSSNILPINDYLPALHATDKWFGYQLLQHDGLLIPETKIFFREDYTEYAGEGQSEEDGRKYLAALERKVVLKPNRLHSGKGITITTDAEQALEGFKEALAWDHLVIVQEFIPWDEYRFIYLDGQLLWSYKKLPGEEGQEILNLSQGAVLIEMEEMDEHFIEVGKQAMKAIGLKYGAVDIRIKDIQDGKSPYAILELNSNPVYRQAWEQGYREKVLEIHEKIIQQLLAS